MEEFKTDTHEFKVLFDNKDIDDLKRVASEFISFGYKLVKEVEHEGNTILIYAKKL